MIAPCFCASYKAEIMQGVHSANDRYMIALYSEGANIGGHTETYTSRGEVSGQGYVAGGIPLRGFNVQVDGEAAVLTFNDARWERVTVRDVCAALVYNASKGNRAVGVVALAQKVSATNGQLELFFPAANARDGMFVID